MLFGTFKRALRRICDEAGVQHFTAKNLKDKVFSVMWMYKNHSLLSYFAHCGYERAGSFDWAKAYGRLIRSFEHYRNQPSGR